MGENILMDMDSLLGNGLGTIQTTRGTPMSTLNGPLVSLLNPKPETLRSSYAPHTFGGALLDLPYVSFKPNA